MCNIILYEINMNDIMYDFMYDIMYDIIYSSMISYILLWYHIQLEDTPYHLITWYTRYGIIAHFT